MKNKEQQKKIAMRAVQFQRWSRISATTAAFLGLFSLAGWYTGLDFLKSVIPGFPPIAVNSAFLLILLGVAVLLINRASGDEGKVRQTKIILVFPVMAISLLTLLEYVLKLNLGVDGILFFQIKYVSPDIVRMSPQSALNYCLIGSAIYFMDVTGFGRRRQKFFNALLSFSAAISFFSLFGYLYGVDILHTIPSFKGMAVQTSLSFSLLVFALLAMTPRTNILKIFLVGGLSGYIARKLGLSLLFLVIADIILAILGKSSLIPFEVERLFHFLIISLIFSFLIWHAFKSVDKIAQMERDITRSKELDRAKSDFVFLASHQLRTPLTTISWYTEMLLRGDGGMLNDKQNEYLCEIYSGNRRMIDLVDDLLNTSRVDMGTFQIKPERVKLEEISKSIIKEFMPQIVSKRVHFFEQYPENSELEADPEICRIIIQNLVSNAVKYTPDEGRISIKIKKFEKSFQIEVSDTGYGIPKKQQKKIFTKLYRADNVRSKETNGTGLGLYIIKAIVRQIGGSLRFESEEGKGTTFWIEIPLAIHNFKRKNKS